MRRLSGVLTASLVGAIVGTVPPATAQQARCDRYDAYGNCMVQVPVPVPGTPVNDEDPGSPSEPGPSGPPPVCVWRTVPPPRESTRALYPEAPPDAVWQVLDCGDNPRAERTPGGYRWVPPGSPTGPAPAPPTPEVLADLLFVAVEARMEAPVLGSDPAAGVASVVGVPTFVEVTNWQGPMVVGPECQLGVCVSMTATPSLMFDPGDGSEPIACTPPGSRYVLGGPPLAEQAAGACAYAYPMRSGAESRPVAWPGVVTVTWDVWWTSSVGGAPGPSGSFDPLPFSTPLLRAVAEVGTVVVGGES
jgi:hypothetical protein